VLAEDPGGTFGPTPLIVTVAITTTRIAVATIAVRVRARKPRKKVSGPLECAISSPIRSRRRAGAG